MTTRTASKLFALTLGAAVSMTWLSTVVVGMHSASTPAPQRVELPTVVVVGHKLATPNATAQAKAASAKNS